MKDITLTAEKVTGHDVADPRAFYVAPTPQQFGAKRISPEAVDKVIENRPMPGIPRSHELLENPHEATDRLLRRIFPQYHNDTYSELSDDDLVKALNKAIQDHRALGMADQATLMLEHATSYRGLRRLLKSDEDLLRPDSFIPMEYLPHLFMAVPVWYFYVDRSEVTNLDKINATPDPKPHGKIKNICNRGTRRWCDTFLMFNRRMRSLKDYQGDIIPPKLTDRIRTMAPLCEHLVIMTPYHDVAGRDWSNIAWLRSIDPYVIGFLKNVPYMIVLGRFSDSGTFPLFTEMVADTIAFLKANKEKLLGFNAVQRPYWHEPNNQHDDFYVAGLGKYLLQHTNELLEAFERGELFQWMKEENLQH